MSRVSQINLNGHDVSIDADGEQSLLSVLRDNLDLTGSKYGCGEGQCGACTVLLDGVATRSCITTIGQVGARKVTTIEALEVDGKLHPLQQAFLDAEALQCAYCTSGMIMSAYSLLQKKPDPTEAEIVRAMNGNICRCGTYQRILIAIKAGAKALQGAHA
jgi:aerobic-type carbon monoxide dehydrogenase small subunit (CoxS/CutS family)